MSPQAFRAYILAEADAGVRGGLGTMHIDELDPGDTLVRVEYSSVNYKDALAGTGRGSIARRLPLVGGIDLAGEVEESEAFAPGTRVLVCGCGLSETHHGGYAEYARVPAAWAVPLPPGMTTRGAMAIGTAGLTAALSVARLEHAGLEPGMGPMLVTGATGGVGSFAVDLLAGRGYEVVAVTGKADAGPYLERLGAARVVDREAVAGDGKPLGRAVWAGAIDSVGGSMLAGLLPALRPNGAVASVGLAGGTRLETTVLPFILRGVSLLGINSVMLGDTARRHIWARLAGDLAPRHLEAIVTSEITLEALPGHLDAYFEGPVRGRTVVAVAPAGA